MAKKQKDYCVSSDAKKFRVEITGKMAYNLDYLKKLSVKYDFIVMGRTVKCVFEKDE